METRFPVLAACGAAAAVLSIGVLSSEASTVHAAKTCRITSGNASGAKISKRKHVSCKDAKKALNKWYGDGKKHNGWNCAQTGGDGYNYSSGNCKNKKKSPHETFNWLIQA
jgi:hypothetical protein